MNGFEDTEAYKFAIERGSALEDRAYLANDGFNPGNVRLSEGGDKYKVYLEQRIGNFLYCLTGCTFDKKSDANDFLRLWNEARAQYRGQ